MDPAGEADPFVVAGTRLSSRLLVGTGKFSAHPVMRDAVLASGTNLVTVALRRVDLDRLGDGDILDFVPAGVRLLPNTSGAVDAAEAVRLARLGRAGTGTDWVKLEVTPDPRRLAPDPVETLRAAELLVADGFTVLPYCSADPVLCRRLEGRLRDRDAARGWIGSNRGLRTRDAIESIVAQAGVPVVVDAGLGVPSDAAEAMEVGPTRCWSTPRSRWPGTRSGWRGRSRWRPRPAGSASWPAGVRSRAPPPPRPRPR